MSYSLERREIKNVNSNIELFGETHKINFIEGQDFLGLEHELHSEILNKLQNGYLLITEFDPIDSYWKVLSALPSLMDILTQDVKLLGLNFLNLAEKVPDLSTKLETYLGVDRDTAIAAKYFYNIAQYCIISPSTYHKRRQLSFEKSEIDMTEPEDKLSQEYKDYMSAIKGFNIARKLVLNSSDVQLGKIHHQLKIFHSFTREAYYGDTIKLQNRDSIVVAGDYHVEGIADFISDSQGFFKKREHIILDTLLQINKFKSIINSPNLLAKLKMLWES